MKSNENTSLPNWFQALKPDGPLVISGPCSAETKAQVLETAKRLNTGKTHLYRAGIWKPRTRPGNFEGVGAIGLEWLKEAKAQTGLKTTTEVASPLHVELALEADVDVLWVGARTTVNPFVVQDIANALKGTDKIVFIKNPVNPDLSLWMGAFERFEKNGLSKLAAIHRGFSVYERTKYRNNPKWQVAIDFMQRMPQTPMILDPSHMGGKRALIEDLCQLGLDLNYAGFMIESHINPDEAWSDAAQQITPETLEGILDRLVIRKSSDNTEEYVMKLSQLRSQIDELDDSLVETLGNRMQIVEAIGRLKKEKNVAVLQPQRWKSVLEKFIRAGNAANLSRDFTKNMFRAIHQESIQHQEKVLKK